MLMLLLIDIKQHHYVFRKMDWVLQRATAAKIWNHQKLRTRDQFGQLLEMVSFYKLCISTT